MKYHEINYVDEMRFYGILLSAERGKRFQGGFLRNEIVWAGPHACIVAIAIVVGTSLLIPAQDYYFGLIRYSYAVSFATMLVLALLNRFHSRALSAIEKFEPRTAIEAKAANEQIKLVANFLNTLAIAAVTAAIISQMVTKKPLDSVMTVFALVFALQFHTYAKSIVGRLKDEAVR